MNKKINSRSGSYTALELIKMLHRAGETDQLARLLQVLYDKDIITEEELLFIIRGYN